MRKAHRLATRSFRAKTGEFLAEGPQAVREALAAGVVLEVFSTATFGDWREESRDESVEWNIVDEALIAEIADSVTPQGIVARCRSVVGDELPTLDGANLVVVCENMRDPGNAGAIIRVADAVGAAVVLLIGDSVDPENPKAVRASAGSLFHLPVVSVREIEPTLNVLRAAGLSLLAADGNAAVLLPDVDLSGPTAWVFGSEAHGVSDIVRASVDTAVAIPIYGQAESLNLATAAAVCLYASAAALH